MKRIDKQIDDLLEDKQRIQSEYASRVTDIQDKFLRLVEDEKENYNDSLSRHQGDTEIGLGFALKIIYPRVLFTQSKNDLLSDDGAFEVQATICCSIGRGRTAPTG
jgi:hypothetical protein